MIVIMDALRLEGRNRKEPEGSMYSALVFQAVVCWVVVPLPMFLGYWGMGKEIRLEICHEAGSGHAEGRG